MKKYDFILRGADTDAIWFTKNDQSKFHPKEQIKLINELNAILPKGIIFEDDGLYESFITIKAKNYVTLEYGQDTPKYIGSSFKTSTKELALKELMIEVIESLVYEKTNYVDIYEKYVEEVKNITDISRWCKKKSITENLLAGNDTAKKKVLKAIESIEYRVGDKVFLFNDIDGTIQKVVKDELVFLKSGEPKMIENKILRLNDDFNGKYDMKHYFKRVYDTMSILKPVINMDNIVNYSLVKNYKNIVYK